MPTPSSPYLSNQYRLADVVAAVQVLGAYPWSNSTVERWAERLGEPKSANAWQTIFAEHPEFFRSGDGRASLRWRHAYDRVYAPSVGRELTQAELAEWTQERRNTDLSQRPLSPDQIQTLLHTAIELHTRAIALKEEVRWLTPLLFGLLGAILGALLRT